MVEQWLYGTEGQTADRLWKVGTLYVRSQLGSLLCRSQSHIMSKKTGRNVREYLLFFVL